MTKILTGLAALMIVGAAALPVPASAVEQGITKVQSTELSSQRHWRRHGWRHPGWRHRHLWVCPRWRHRHVWAGPRWHRYGWRRHWGPRWGYYRPYRYGYYGYPGYYHRPALAFGIGPFGFGVF